MLTLLLTTILAVVTSAYASCTSLGPGATDTVAGGFKLSIYNPATDTTTPLKLLVTHIDTGAAYQILSTGSGEDFGWLGFTMSNGALATISPTPSELLPIHYAGLNAPPSSPLYPAIQPWPLFYLTYAYPSNVVCSVPNPSGGDNILALNGYTDMFSLCESSFTSFLPLADAIVFNASSTAVLNGYNTYDGSSCVQVTVLLVPT